MDILMSIEPETVSGVKSLAVQPPRPDMAQSNDESFDYLLTGILNTLLGSSFISSPSPFGSGDPNLPLAGRDRSPDLSEEGQGGFSGDILGLCLSDISFFQKYNITLSGHTQPGLEGNINQWLMNQNNPTSLFGSGDPNLPLTGRGLPPFSKGGQGGFSYEGKNNGIEILKNFSDVRLLQNPVTMPSESTTSIPYNETQAPLDNASIRLFISDELSQLDKFIQVEQLASREQDKGSPRAEVGMKPESIFLNFDNTTNSNNVTCVQHVKESPEVIYIPGNTFVITKKDDTSIDVFLETDRLGKLHIELTLDKGVINAQISASEAIGKDLIVRNLHNILNTLNNEGLNIGSFSVFLRDKRDEVKDNVRREDPKVPQSNKEIQLPISYCGIGKISIFV